MQLVRPERYEEFTNALVSLVQRGLGSQLAAGADGAEQVRGAARGPTEAGRRCAGAPARAWAWRSSPFAGAKPTLLSPWTLYPPPPPTTPSDGAGLPFPCSPTELAPLATQTGS